MAEFIRQLPHDNQQLNNQWSGIFDKLHKLLKDIPEKDLPDAKVKLLDALVDYILADTDEVAQIKQTFVEVTIKTIKDDPLPSLTELVRIFCRVLDIPNTNNLLSLTFLKEIHYKFQLGKRLSVGPSVDLIDSIFISLQKHEFLNKDLGKNSQEQWKYFLSRAAFSPLSSDTNKFNEEKTMSQMTRSFQQLYR
jgi:hypothetical protein